MTDSDVIEQILESLRDVIDPELGVNVVDLGLVYDTRIDDDGNVQIDLTLTSPGCPDAGFLRDVIYKTLGELELDITICVNWVWKPTWGPECITVEGREQLRALGFAI